MCSVVSLILLTEKSLLSSVKRGGSRVRELSREDAARRREQAGIRRQEQENPDFGVLAFQHMALPEYAEVFRYETCYGTRREGYGCPRRRTGPERQRSAG